MLDFLKDVGEGDEEFGLNLELQNLIYLGIRKIQTYKIIPILLKPTVQVQ